MQWWDIYVQVPEPMGETVSVYLQHLGSGGVVIHESAMLSLQGEACLDTSLQASGWTVLYGALPVDEALPVRVCALQQFLNAYPSNIPALLWKLYCRPCPSGDYLTQWQHFFPPLYIAQRLVIRPPWDTSAVPSGIESLVLDPGQAFGTGLHPTTHLCLTLLARCSQLKQHGWLLDVGCGSGILSLAALKLGYERALGVDIDAQAISVAEHNAVLNGLQQRVQFRQGSVEAATGQFAVITANIYLGPLVDMMPALVERLAPQGSILLAGILEHQEAALRAALHTAGLQVHARLVEEGWVALEGQHTGMVSEP
jgi:ribosomal protein L11 methyltransferase